MRDWSIIVTVSRWVAVVVLGAGLALPLSAQIRGIPPSVTSIGSGSTPFTPGIGPSVTSLGPAGLVDRFGTSITVPHGQTPRFRPVHAVIPFFWPVIYQPQPQPPVVVVQAPPPVVVVVERDGGEEDSDSREPLVLEWKGDKYVRVSPGGENEEAEGGVVLEKERSAQDDRKPARRGARVRKPARRVPRAVVEESEAAKREPEPEPETPATVLVFHDGRRTDVRNYAIVADLFYDLSDRLPKKILLADLDLKATIAANEERGLEFRLPTASSPNQVITRP